MNDTRRRLLRYMGATAASGVTGCVGDANPGGGNESNDTDGANTTVEEVERNETDTETDTDDDTETDEESVREHHDQVMKEAREIHVQSLADGRYKAYTPFDAPFVREDYRHGESSVNTTSYFVASEADTPPTFRTVLINDSEEPFEVDASEFAPYGRLPRGTKDENGRVDTVYLAPFETDGDLENLAEVRQEDGVWYVDEVRDWLPETLVVDGEDWLTIDYALVVGETGDWSTGRYVFGEETDFDLVIWDAESPGPERESRFEGTEVPPLEDMETSWYHEADTTTPVYFEPSKEVVEPPATVEFTAVNRSEEPMGVDASSPLWVRKLVDGEWFVVKRQIPLREGRLVGRGLPGQDVEFSLHVFHGEAKDLPLPRNREGEVAEFLGGGTYAVDPYNEGLAALIEVDAPPLEVEPKEDAVVDRRGSTVVVTRSLYFHGSTENISPPAFAVERAQDTEGIDERLIPEQVMREPLRNALPFFKDDEVERVVVETRTHNVDDALEDGDERRFVYEGNGYVVRRAEEED